jgi:hypothetical protein
MKTLNVRLAITGLVAVAITAGHLFIPDTADAAGGAMFRVLRSFHGLQGFTLPDGEQYSDPFYNAYSEPNPGGPGSYAPATALFTTMGGFTIPRHVIHFGTAEFDAYTFSCVVGTCGAGYPVSIYYYSYYNYKGIFGPQNPFAVTTTSTLNRVADSPGFTTTMFNNNYAFARSGSIQVTPGPNRFGGTMRYFWGVNARGYQQVTTATPCCELNYFHAWRSGSDEFGRPTGMLDQTEYEDQYLGFTYIGIVGTRIHTNVTTGGSAMNAATRMTIAPRTTAPWTTGGIRVFQSGGIYISSVQITGFDNRTENRELGALSMVTPWLTNNYITSYNPTDPISSGFKVARAFQMSVNFMPEPAGILFLGSGILALMGLYRIRGK